MQDQAAGAVWNRKVFLKVAGTETGNFFIDSKLGGLCFYFSEVSILLHYRCL